MPPTPAFLNLCSAAKIDVPKTIALRVQFLNDGGIPATNALPTKQLGEQSAALAWARNSLANNVDPDTWPTVLPPNLLATLQALYALPPVRGPPPAPSDLRRLADVILLYDPNGAAPAAPPPPPPNAPAPGAPPAPPPPGAGGINTIRPPGATGAPAPSGAAGTGAAGAGPGAGGSAAGSSPSLPLATKRLLHDELSVLLPRAVYYALDSSTGMNGEKRAKYQKALRDSSLATLLDDTVAAPFHHLTLLELTEGTHFDPLKRGLALAGAGRSAAAPGTFTTQFAETVTREAYLRSLQALWPEIETALAAPHELSSTIVNRLWAGVVFIMTLRAARSTTWGVPEVADACKAQLDALPSYRTNITTTLARVSSAYVGAEVARSVNRAYAQFFLPFWWEHILERGPIDPDKHEKAAEALLAPRPPVPPPALAPGPTLALPPAYVPPVPLAWPPPAPYPYGVPLAPAPPPVYGQPMGGYHPPAPTQPQPAPGPAPTPTPNPGPGPARTPGFLGKPVSHIICGNNFGQTLAGGKSRPCSCLISRAFQGRIHYPFECPLRYHAQRGACPGWTATGARIPSAWNGDDITPATQAEWRTLVTTLPSAFSAGSVEVKF